MSLILKIGQCPDCAASINIEHLIQEKMGFAQFFRLSCVECKWYRKFCTSKECCRTEPKSGRKRYELNRRTIVAFCDNGQGYAGMNTICRWMNMPPPMAENTFHDINSCIHNAYVETSHESMTNAACEVHKISNDNNQTSSSHIANTKVNGY